MPTTFEKTWQFQANQAADQTGTGGGYGKYMIWWVKAFLKGDLSSYKDSTGATIGSPTGFWTVYYSCDGSTAGTAADGVDRWGSPYDSTKMVLATGANPHSWCILKSPIGLGPFYLIIDCNVTNATTNTSCSISLLYCRTAPTGGTTTARPTSVDEVANLNWNNQSWYAANSTNIPRMHGGLTTDGNFHIITSTDDAGFKSGVIWQVLAEAKSTDNWPALMWFGPAVTPLQNNLQTQSTVYSGMRNRNGLTSLIAGVGAPCAGSWNSSTNGPVLSGTTNMISVDFTDSLYDDLPIYWYVSQAGFKSIRGRWYDYRWAPSSLSNGAIESSVTAPLSMIWGNIWVPCYTAPLL